MVSLEGIQMTKNQENHGTGSEEEIWNGVCERWYEHKIESVIENDIMKILWDVCIQMDRQTEHQRQDIVVMEKNTKRCLIIHVACPAIITWFWKETKTR